MSGRYRNFGITHYLLTLILFTAAITIPRLTDGRDRQTIYNCNPGEIPKELRNNDGYLELTCVSKDVCEELQDMSEICGEWLWPSKIGGCNDVNWWIGGIRRIKMGTGARSDKYIIRCCTHPQITRLHMAFKSFSLGYYGRIQRPNQGGFYDGLARGSELGSGDFYDLPISLRKEKSKGVSEHYRMMIQTIRCRQQTTTTTTTTPSTTTTTRRRTTTPRRPREEENKREEVERKGEEQQETKKTENESNNNNENPEEVRREVQPDEVPVETGSEGQGSVGTQGGKGGNGGGGSGGSGVGLGGSGGGACFPPDLQLITPPGQPGKSMETLRIGDLVAVAPNRFEPITRFIHRDPHLSLNYVRIETRHGTAVTLSERHLIPIVKCPKNNNALSSGQLDDLIAENNDHQVMSDWLNQHGVFADEARLGLCLIVKVNSSNSSSLRLEPIRRISKFRQQGAFSPLTPSGYLMVVNHAGGKQGEEEDGKGSSSAVLVSCYSSVRSHGLFHAVAWYYDWFSQLLSSSILIFFPGGYGDLISIDQSAAFDTHIPVPLQFAYRLYNLAVSV